MASASLHTPQPTVLVVDFGAQYAQLIARRVREAQVYSEIVPHRISASEVQARKPIAIILSGGPASVHVEGAPILDREIFELGIPILGICYGAQLIAQQLGGVVARGGRGASGGSRAPPQVEQPSVPQGAAVLPAPAEKQQQARCCERCHRRHVARWHSTQAACTGPHLLAVRISTRTRSHWLRTRRRGGIPILRLGFR